MKFSQVLLGTLQKTLRKLEFYGRFFQVLKSASILYEVLLFLIVCLIIFDLKGTA